MRKIVEEKSDKPALFDLIHQGIEQSPNHDENINCGIKSSLGGNLTDPTSQLTVVS